MKANRLHCHSGPSAALATGSGDVALSVTSTATQANTTNAAANATPLRVHVLDIMALGSCSIAGI
jgi:hypothetical protein